MREVAKPHMSILLSYVLKLLITWLDEILQGVDNKQKSSTNFKC